MLERGAKRVVQRLLGEVEVAEQADERCEDPAGLGAVDPVDHRSDGLGCCFAHRVCGECDIIVATRSSVAALQRSRQWQTNAPTAYSPVRFRSSTIRSWFR